MAHKTYAEYISDTKVMIDGLRNNLSNLPAGITEEFINDLEKLKASVETLNSEQEKIKSDLRVKTQAFEQEYKKLQAKFSETKKRVKLDFAQGEWKQFGIEDKR